MLLETKIGIKLLYLYLVQQIQAQQFYNLIMLVPGHLLSLAIVKLKIRNANHYRFFMIL